MTHHLTADATGITARGLRVRHLDAAEVRRIHRFVDATGDAGVVVRRNLWRFVYVPNAALRDPALLDGLRALARAVEPSATIDADVEALLADGPAIGDTLLDAAA